MEIILKLIICDVDGVLNHLNLELEGAGDPLALDHTNWNRQCVQMLNSICFLTDAKVVISSSWRKHQPNIQWWNTEFRACGARWIEVIGITGRSSNGFRGREVYENFSVLNEYFGEKINYVCIDDDTDFYDNQPLIRTDPQYGLTHECVDDAIRCLKTGWIGYQGTRMVENNPPATG